MISGSTGLEGRLLEGGRTLDSSRTVRALANGATASGAVAIATLAIGTLAFGALAIGSLAAVGGLATSYALAAVTDGVGEGRVVRRRWA